MEALTQLPLPSTKLKKPSRSLFTCSVCSLAFRKPKKLKKHQMSSGHSQNSGLEESWGDNADKHRCLIAYYGKFVEAEGKQWIKDNFNGKFNFLSWNDRPKIGILEFDTREEANEGFTSNKCHTDEKPEIILKQANQLHDSEWIALFPPKIADRITNATFTFKKPLQPEELTPGEKLIKEKRRLKRKRESTDATDDKQVDIEAVLKMVKIEIGKGVNPVRVLHNVAFKLKWTSPTYKITPIKDGAKSKEKDCQGFDCSVSINQVEKVKSEIFCRAEKDAKRQITIHCLKNIVASWMDEKDSSNEEGSPKKLRSSLEQSTSKVKPTFLERREGSFKCGLELLNMLNVAGRKGSRKAQSRSTVV